MHCPACKTTTLAMTERQGIEIDYCPDCRGIWLDRGELDRLLARVEQAAPPPAPASRHPSVGHPPAYPDRQHDRRDRHDDRDAHGYRRRKPKSLLGELFDF